MNDIEAIGSRNGPIGSRLENRSLGAQQKQDEQSQIGVADLVALMTSISEGLKGIVPVQPAQQTSSGPSTDPRSAELFMKQKEGLAKTSAGAPSQQGSNIFSARRTGTVMALQNLMMGGSGQAGGAGNAGSAQMPGQGVELSEKATQYIERQARRQEDSAKMQQKTSPGSSLDNFLGQAQQQDTTKVKKFKNPTAPPPQ